MRLLWKSHKRFPLVDPSILPATRGTGTPASAASATTSSQNPAPRKPPKCCISELHSSRSKSKPQGRRLRRQPRAASPRRPHHARRSASLPAPRQPPGASGSHARLSTSGDVGCGWPCRHGKEGLWPASAARGSPSPALPLASHPSTLRRHLLQASAASATGGPRLPPSCWPNPAIRHLSHLPGDSWGPSGVTHPSARAHWLQGSCARPSRMRASAMGKAGACTPPPSRECCWQCRRPPGTLRSPSQPDCVRLRVPWAGTHCRGMRRTPRRCCEEVARRHRETHAVLARPRCPALPEGWFAHPRLGCQPLPGAQRKARGGIRPPRPQLLLPGLAPAWEPQLSVTEATVRGSGAGTAAGARAGLGRRAGLGGNASPSSEHEQGCAPVAREKGPDCG